MAKQVSQPTADTKKNESQLKPDESEEFLIPEDTLVEYDPPSADIEAYFDQPYHIRCLGEITLSRSSLITNPFWLYKQIDDPGLAAELWAQEKPRQYNTIGVERYIDLCKKYHCARIRRFETELPTDGVNLRFYQPSTLAVRIVLETLQYNDYVLTCDLTNATLEPVVGTYISNMLKNNHTLSTLILHKCRLGPEGIKNLACGLEESDRLEELDLSYNNVGNEGIKAIAPSLMKNLKIQKLNLSHNNITGISGPILGEVFGCNNNITWLDLSWNTWDDVKSFKELMAGFRLNSANNLKHLNLAWCSLAGYSGDSIAGVLANRNTQLEYLNLAFNRYTGNGARMLLTGVEKSKSLKEIVLSGNPMTDDEIGTFITFLATEASSIRILDFSDNYVDSKYKPLIAMMRKENKVFRNRGFFHDYTIIGPDYGLLLLTRCRVIVAAMAKKAKKKKDPVQFGTFFYNVTRTSITQTEFRALIDSVKCSKLSNDTSLLHELILTFEGAKKDVLIGEMRDLYLLHFPDTPRPPASEKPVQGEIIVSTA